MFYNHMKQLNNHCFYLSIYCLGKWTGSIS
jgi:hypothetical protein